MSEPHFLQVGFFCQYFIQKMFVSGRFLYFLMNSLYYNSSVFFVNSYEPPVPSAETRPDEDGHAARVRARGQRHPSRPAVFQVREKHHLSYDSFHPPPPPPQYWSWNRKNALTVWLKRKPRLPFSRKLSTVKRNVSFSTIKKSRKCWQVKGRW